MAIYERKDFAYRRAREGGYRSRAAFKLIELDRQLALLRPGLRVVDVGCWPGAWLQVASGCVGPAGRVVGLDLVATEDLGLANTTVLVGDVRDPAVRARVAEVLGGPAHVVLADLAPKLSGIRSADSAHQATLVAAALAGAEEWLTQNGVFLVKLFMDEEYPRLIGRLRTTFAAVKTTRPPSTRRGSAEIYACARGFR